MALLVFPRLRLRQFDIARRCEQLLTPEFLLALDAVILLLFLSLL